jgi:Holliday junction resolvase RusA-like endonuclease
MLTNVAFVVPGEPQGKGRPRVGRIAGQARMFTPPKTVAYEGLIAAQAYQAMRGDPPLTGPVLLELELVHVMPASWSKKKRVAISVPQCKPDVDNVIKAVGDGGNGVLWMDDKQIAMVSARRVWGDRPEVRVRVATMEAACQS